MKVDRNKRLCSREVQNRIRAALEIIDSDSLRWILHHNCIEYARLAKASAALKELLTCQTRKGGIIW